MGQWAVVCRRVARSSAFCPAVHRGFVLFRCPEGRPGSPLLSEHTQPSQQEVWCTNICLHQHHLTILVSQRELMYVHVCTQDSPAEPDGLSEGDAERCSAGNHAVFSRRCGRRQDQGRPAAPPHGGEDPDRESLPQRLGPAYQLALPPRQKLQTCTRYITTMLCSLKIVSVFLFLHLNT